MIKRQSMFYKNLIFVLFLLVCHMIAAQSSTSCNESLLTQIEKAKEAYKLANYEKAQELAMKVLDNEEKNNELSCVADIYHLIGKIRTDGFNDHEQALNYFLKEQFCRQKSNQRSTIDIGNLSYYKGICYFHLGAYYKSKKYFQYAFDLLVIDNNQDSNLKGFMMYLSSIYMVLNDFKRVEEFLEENIKPRLNETKFNINLLAFYEIRANLLMNQKEYKKSLDLHFKVIEMYKKHLPEKRERIAGLLYFTGRVYYHMDNVDEAIKYFKKGLKLTKRNNKSVYNFGLGEAYVKKRLFFEGLDCFQKGIVDITQNYDDYSIANNPKPNDFYTDYEFVLALLQNKGETLKNIYKSNCQEKYLKFSIKTFQKADTLIAVKYKKNQSAESILSTNHFLSSIYSSLIDSYWLMFEKTGKAKYLDLMFTYSEKNRSFLLNQSRNKSKSDAVSLIPQNIINKQKVIASKIAQNQSAALNYQNVNNSKPLEEIKTKLFSLNLKKDSLESVIRKQYPKYHQLTYDNTIISVKEIQNKLSKNATLLECFVADSTTYAFTISKDKYGVTLLEIDSLEDTITQFNNAIIAKDAENYNELAYSLYQKLIVPVQHTLKGEELIVVPDGPLWHLNFDLLLTQQTTSEAYQELPYFLSEKVISYANSANLLFNQVYDDQKKNIKECLAFSFADTTKTDQGSTMDLAVLRNTDDDLPGTRKEIKAISEIINGKYYYGKEAIEDNFKSNATNYNILHLALHGEVDNEHPENSKLFFTKNKDSIEDNYLYNHELYAMDIPAELVVLSACNTGAGKVAKGEGIMSLGRAFQYAGAKSLVLTNWEVSDETTPILMRNFYANLKQGMNKAKALQQAKLQYLHTANVYNSDPFYWGGFYLIGDTTAIDFNEKSSHWYWVSLLLALLSMILGFWFLRQKRKRS
ncbi:CHAT domain-containing tetratricopeptide repeat protein [uncultured Aquimarina sp.]|uniref:CHAT domain-containing protein n=1 Tax=uncultured Aquimarina sp. TaxID=575652 RepID=UPI0026186DAF|nr:CHAT domain-containing tetratricopeptide repeat protein [uncultured Aquimarina sp.]